MVEKQNDLKEVIVHLRTPSGAPAGTRKDLSGESAYRYVVDCSLRSSQIRYLLQYPSLWLLSSHFCHCIYKQLARSGDP